MNIRKIALIIITLALINCKRQSVKVVGSFDKQAMEELKELNLDSLYINAFDYRNTTKEEHTIVVNSWQKFHEGVLTFMDQENFSWDTSDSTVTIFNKIYFNKKGMVDYYTFRISNKSITENKRKEFSQILKKFSENIQMDINRDTKYSQCGSTRHTVN